MRVVLCADLLDLGLWSSIFILSNVITVIYAVGNRSAARRLILIGMPLAHRIPNLMDVDTPTQTAVGVDLGILGGGPSRGSFPQ